MGGTYGANAACNFSYKQVTPTELTDFEKYNTVGVPCLQRCNSNFEGSVGASCLLLIFKK